MSIPQLTSCCCGCSLKTGAKIIAWLGMIPAVLAFLAAVIVIPILYSQELIKNADKELFYAVMFGFLVVVCVIAGGFAAILLVGVYKERARMLLVWIIITFSCCLLRLAFLLIALFATASPLVLVELIVMAIDFYLLLVLYSFYREICQVPHGRLIV